jgi:hypothetical protein
VLRTADIVPSTYIDVIVAEGTGNTHMEALNELQYAIEQLDTCTEDHKSIQPDKKHWIMASLDQQTYDLELMYAGSVVKQQKQ